MAQGVKLDLLVYHDMTDYVGADLSLMADAGEQLGDMFAGYRVVAVGGPIHPGKDKTVVLAHRRDTDPDMQALLKKLPPS